MKATIRQEIIDDGLLIPVDNEEDWVDGNIRATFEARFNGPDFEINLDGRWVQAISMDFELY